MTAGDVEPCAQALLDAANLAAGQFNTRDVVGGLALVDRALRLLSLLSGGRSDERWPRGRSGAEREPQRPWTSCRPTLRSSEPDAWLRGLGAERELEELVDADSIERVRFRLCTRDRRGRGCDRARAGGHSDRAAA